MPFIAAILDVVVTSIVFLIDSAGTLGWAAAVCRPAYKQNGGWVMGVGPACWTSFRIAIPLALLLAAGCSDAAQRAAARETVIVAMDVMIRQAVEATITARDNPTVTEAALPAQSDHIPPTATPVCRLTLTAEIDTRVREGPGSNYREAGWLFAGQSVEVIGRDDLYVWWVVFIDGRTVWVHGQTFTLSDCANYPAAFPTPPPG